MSTPLVILRVHRGKEKEEEAKLMGSLGISRIVAGDQNVEDHLKYMEEMAGMAGAELREPIWGMDSGKVLEDELREMSFIVIGAEERARELVCARADESSSETFRRNVRELGIDPIGEAGEYHSLVTEIRPLGASIGARCREVRSYGDYYVALVD